METFSQPNHPHAGNPVLTSGLPFDQAKSAMILIHGRGSSAQNILELSTDLFHPSFIYIAPQATGNTWYPYSFLAPIPNNEPGISSGFQIITSLINEITSKGISKDRIILTGFSQGACLVSEFAARNPSRYGGIILFSGGLIGPLGLERNYSGTLNGTSVFLGCSDKDFHIPLERVLETSNILEKLEAQVTLKIYPDMDHTIIQDEIDNANKIVQKIGASH